MFAAVSESQTVGAEDVHLCKATGYAVETRCEEDDVGFALALILCYSFLDKFEYGTRFYVDPRSRSL